MSQIAKEYNTYPLKIRNILVDNGIEIIRSPKRINKFLKENFFETIDTEEKAYWLGILFTDGSVVKKKECNSYVIRLEVQERDIDLINKFKYSLNSESKITTSSHNKNGKTIKSVLTTISSNKMANDLSQYGIIPNKTYLTDTLPSVQEKLIPHFLRGLIDGDGSIFNNDTYSIKYDKIYERSGIYFCSYHEQCCEDFLKMALTLLTNPNNKEKVSKEKGMYRIKFSSKQDVCDLCSKLYLNSNIYLNRKYQKAIEILERFNHHH